jgi:beta-galactosidase
MDGKIAGAAQKWCDVITPNNAVALAYYNEEFYKGAAAITCNTYGNGNAYYIGLEPDEKLLCATMDAIMDKHHIQTMGNTADGVEVVRRSSDDGTYYFMLNHGDTVVAAIPNPGWKAVLGSEMLEPYGMAIFFERDTHALKT